MRTKAFTLVEVLVSLIISSLIVGMVWAVYFFVGNYRSSIENKVSNQLLTKRAEYWINRDFSFSSKATLSNDGIQLNGNHGSINYLLQESYFIRNTGVSSDTVDIYLQIRELAEFGSYSICFNPDHHSGYCFTVSLPKSSERLQKVLDENS